MNMTLSYNYFQNPGGPWYVLGSFVKKDDGENMILTKAIQKQVLYVKIRL